MKTTRVGIAYEGGSDIEVLKIWTRRIFGECGLNCEDMLFSDATPSTGLLGFLPVFMRKFDDERAVMAVFCTDQDKDADSRRRQIMQRAMEINPAFAERVVAAVPSPHIEKWLLLQDSVVKNILMLDGAEKLPHANEQPKYQLTMLYSESNYKGSLRELKMQIAKEMDLGYSARNNAEFGHFLQDVMNIANRLKEEI